jgi:pimeloyl-ACP methyl ester carboxylesterase
MSKVNRAGRNTRDIDLDQAIQCVELAQLSYRDPAEASALALRRYGYLSFHAMSRREQRDYLLVVEDDRHTLIAVRGTDDYRDWLTNLKIWRRDTPFGRVHRGYHDVASSFLSELGEVLSGRGSRPILLTGHSMGGGVATLLAVELERSGATVSGLYTFGQPQLGFGGVRAYYRAHSQFEYVRFVHGADAFAVWTIGGSRLPGTPCYFDLRGRISFGNELDHVPRPDLRFHRLEYYRHFLRLNRLRERAMSESNDATLVQRR